MGNMVVVDDDDYDTPENLLLGHSREVPVEDSAAVQWLVVARDEYDDDVTDGDAAAGRMEATVPCEANHSNVVDGGEIQKNDPCCRIHHHHMAHFLLLHCWTTTVDDEDDDDKDDVEEDDVP